MALSVTSPHDFIPSRLDFFGLGNAGLADLSNGKETFQIIEKIEMRPRFNPLQKIQKAL